jgi:hypothetical protein
MRPPIILLAGISATLAATSFAVDRWCQNDGIPCPQTSSRWTLYEDSNPGAPDFWWKTDPLEVREISLCDHGIHFVFQAMHGGRLRTTALVFPRPSESMLAERLGLEPASEALETEFVHYRDRYTSLLSEIERISRGALVERTHARFDSSCDGDGPSIVASRRLELLWNGEALKLRGYLDVYFLEPSDRLVADAGVESAPAGEQSLRVVPNPGRGGAYTVAYAVPSPGPVSVEIFEVSGRRIATLVRGAQEAGSRSLSWDGRAPGGDTIRPGVYFARLTTSRGARTAKFVHLGG